MLLKSRKKFLFGRIYNIVEREEEKIDDSCILESEIEDIYKDKTVYEINKTNYLEDVYDNQNTLKNEYNTYNACILYSEIAKEKDVSEFSSLEIKILVESVPTSSKVQQDRIFRFINQYCKYKVDKGAIPLNPCDELDVNEFTPNIAALKQKVIGLDKFWQMIRFMMASGAGYQDVMCIVLARYGITGKANYDMVHLRYEDIDKENKLATIYNEDGSVKTRVPIDDRLIEFIEKSKDETEVNSNYRAIYPMTGYVVRRSTFSGEGDIETFPMIVKRTNKAYKYAGDYPKVKFNNLAKSRKIDMILRIRKERFINTNDILTAIRMFDPNATDGGWVALGHDYTSLTDDHIYFKYEKGKKLEDPNAEQFVKDVAEKLQFEGYDK